MALWKDLFSGGRRGKEVPGMLHEAVMGQALNSIFYGHGLLEDNFQGRFECTTIHAMLLFRRLRRAGEAGESLAQDVFGTLFSSFDDALREMGTGDLKVGKKIKDIAKAFYGRAEAYDDALKVEGEEGSAQLVDALERNTTLEASSAARMAEYIFKADAKLLEQSDESFLKGNLEWPDSF